VVENRGIKLTRRKMVAEKLRGTKRMGNTDGTRKSGVAMAITNAKRGMEWEGEESRSLSALVWHRSSGFKIDVKEIDVLCLFRFST